MAIIFDEAAAGAEDRIRAAPPRSTRLLTTVASQVPKTGSTSPDKTQPVERYRFPGAACAAARCLRDSETGPGGYPRPPHASPSRPFLPCFHCATVALASLTFIVSRAMRPCSMAVGRQGWNLETRERWLEVDEARGVLPR